MTSSTGKMGQEHDHDTIHITKYGTVVMAVLQYDKTPVVNSAKCTGYMHSVMWGIPCPLGFLYKGHQGERSPQPPEEAHFSLAPWELFFLSSTSSLAPAQCSLR
jgi:hypothetical protein